MNKKMIEKLKNNLMAFSGLSEEEQKFLKEHWRDVQVFCVNDYWDRKYKDTFFVCNVYRLKPDFKLEPEYVYLPVELSEYGWYGVCKSNKIAFPIGYSFIAAADLVCAPNFRGFYIEGLNGILRRINDAAYIAELIEADGHKVVARFEV